MCGGVVIGFAVGTLRGFSPPAALEHAESAEEEGLVFSLRAPRSLRFKLNWIFERIVNEQIIFAAADAGDYVSESDFCFADV